MFIGDVSFLSLFCYNLWQLLTQRLIIMLNNMHLIFTHDISGVDCLLAEVNMLSGFGGGGGGRWVLLEEVVRSCRYSEHQSPKGDSMLSINFRNVIHLKQWTFPNAVLSFLSSCRSLC